MSKRVRYFKTYKSDGKRIEVSYQTALNTLLTVYRDNELTREMLTQSGVYPCMFSIIEVVND